MLSLKKTGFAILAALDIAGCATTPDPTYYLFPTPEVAASTPYTGGTIAVREISLPLYARAQQIASIAGDGSVVLSDDHRWADEPPRASTRALVSTLKQALGASIVSEPWPATVKPAIRIDVTVDRFIGDTEGGDLEFSGQYEIITVNAASTAPDVQDSFSYRIPIDAAGYQALANAHAAAISKLALEIAAQISGQSS